MSPAGNDPPFQGRGPIFSGADLNVRKTVYSVSELTRRLKDVIESNFPFVWLRGEISNLRLPGSGHCYFTLKDESAQIAAVIFRPGLRQAKFVPEDGMTIIGLGRLSVYEPRGAYQIILEYIEPAGLGALQLAFEKLKNRLAEQGYFDARHKKPLPFLPYKIAVVTSPSGAVVHDIITVISRRFPNVHLVIAPVKVQGAGAEEDIVAALRLVNARADADLIILARGGGSLEDLQAFNSEAVAMAIFESAIPIVSAVGHETDVTIADFIADMRAATPSAAAELAVPDKNELARRRTELQRALENRMNDALRGARLKVVDLTRRLGDPRRRIQELWLRSDDLGSRLIRAGKGHAANRRQRIEFLSSRLRAHAPRNGLLIFKAKLQKNIDNLKLNINKLIQSKNRLMAASAIRLDALNPLSILGRGYSVTRSLPDRRVVAHPDQVELDQDVEVLIAQGRLLCNVKGKWRHGQENV